MDRILIRGGRPLSGEIAIGGAKNAALPLMAAGLLTGERLVLTNVPRLADIATMTALIAQHGVAVDPVSNDGRALSIGGTITNTEAPYDIVRKMRASVLVLGPLLARVGEARVSLPGGCAIGTRPVDLHLKGLEQLGAEIRLDGGYIHATAARGLRGATIVMPFVSVGATENLLMAASLTEGRTVLANAAREPEIGDLAACLIAMGARIEGIGTDRLTIDGVRALHGATHPIIPDRIETGTYACAAAITGGDVRLAGAGCARGAASERAARRRRDDRALSRLPDRHAGAVHGADVGRRRGGDGDRDDLREPLHARAGAQPHGGPDQRARRVGDRPGCGAAFRCAGDGDGSARLGVAGTGGAGGKGRDGGEPGLSPRPRV